MRRCQYASLGHESAAFGRRFPPDLHPESGHRQVTASGLGCLKTQTTNFGASISATCVQFQATYQIQFVC